MLQTRISSPILVVSSGGGVLPGSTASAALSSTGADGNKPMRKSKSSAGLPLTLSKAQALLGLNDVQMASAAEDMQLSPPDSPTPTQSSVVEPGPPLSPPIMWQPESREDDSIDSSEVGHEEITRFASAVVVSARRFYLSPASWQSDPGSRIKEIFVHATFGAAASKWPLAGALKQEQTLSASSVPVDENSWELSFQLNTDALVSDDYLEKSPDLAYNIPARVQVLAELEDSTRVVLAECSRYLDISEAKVSAIDFDFSRGWRIASAITSMVKFEISDVRKYY